MLGGRGLGQEGAWWRGELQTGGGSTRTQRSSQSGDATGHAAYWGKGWELKRRLEEGSTVGELGAAPLQDTRSPWDPQPSHRG